MTTSTEIIQSTTTQVVTFGRCESSEFLDLVRGLDQLFAEDTVGGRFDVQIDSEELHVQVNAPDEGITAVGEIMLHGWAAREADEVTRTEEELFKEIVDRFGEEEDSKKVIQLGEVVTQAAETQLFPDQIDDLRVGRSMRIARVLEAYGDREYRRWKP